MAFQRSIRSASDLHTSSWTVFLTLLFSSSLNPPSANSSSIRPGDRFNGLNDILRPSDSGMCAKSSCLGGRILCLNSSDGARLSRDERDDGDPGAAARLAADALSAAASISSGFGRSSSSSTSAPTMTGDPFSLKNDSLRFACRGYFGVFGRCGLNSDAWGGWCQREPKQNLLYLLSQLEAQAFALPLCGGSCPAVLGVAWTLRFCLCERVTRRVSFCQRDAFTNIPLSSGHY